MDAAAAEALILLRAGRLSNVLIGVAVLAFLVFILKVFRARELYIFDVKISSRDFPVVFLFASGVHGLLAFSYDSALKRAADLPAPTRRAIVDKLTHDGPSLFDNLFERISVIRSISGIRFVFLDAFNPINYMFYGLVLCVFASVIFWRDAALDTKAATILFSLALLLFNWTLASAWILRTQLTLIGVA